jgi:hypothetical protein
VPKSQFSAGADTCLDAVIPHVLPDPKDRRAEVIGQLEASKWKMNAEPSEIRGDHWDLSSHCGTTRRFTLGITQRTGL